MIIELSGDTFAKNLAYLRKKHKLSYRALGKLIDFSPHFLRCIERRITYPALPFEAFQRLSEVFHVSHQALSESDLSMER